MKEINQKIVDKIKKLLELTTSPNEHEASLAMEQAKNLMARHSVGFEDLDEEKFKQEIVSETYTNSLLAKPGVFDHMGHIINVIAPIFGVHYLVNTIGRRISGYTLYGFKSNLEVARFALDSLLAQGNIDAKREYKKYRTITFGAGFWSGFAVGLNRKFGQVKDQTTGIVVYDRVKQFVYDNSKGSIKLDRGDSVAFNSGVQSGLEAELRSGLKSSNEGKLLS